MTLTKAIFSNRLLQLSSTLLNQFSAYEQHFLKKGIEYNRLQKKILKQNPVNQPA